MYEDVFILLIIFSFVAFVCTGVYKLVMAKLKSGGDIDQDRFDRLAKAFIDYRKKTDRRLENIEAILTAEESSSTASQQQLNDSNHKRQIEIDTDSSGSKSQNSGSKNLENMLNKKRTS